MKTKKIILPAILVVSACVGLWTCIENYHRFFAIDAISLWVYILFMTAICVQSLHLILLETDSKKPSQAIKYYKLFVDGEIGLPFDIKQSRVPFGNQTLAVYKIDTRTAKLLDVSYSNEDWNRELKLNS